MKINSINLFFLLFLNTYMLISNCPLPSSCDESSIFPYYFCQGAERITLCSAHPNEMLGYKALKMKGNCISYDGNFTFQKIIKTEPVTKTKHRELVGYFINPDDPFDPNNGRPYYGINLDGSYIWDESYLITEDEDVPYDYSNLIHIDDVDPNSTVIFNINSVNNIFSDALNTWKSLSCENDIYCYQDKEPNRVNQCCVKVKWTTDENKFKDDNGNGDPANTYAVTRKRYSSDCSIICNDEFVIYLNQSDIFTGYDSDTKRLPYSLRFFKTENTFGDERTYWYSLKAILKHELGHVFGFADENDPSGIYCQHTGSIMQSGDNPNFYNIDFTLSNEDICMYKKLYCWSPFTKVEETQIFEQGIQIFPNPVNSDFINLQFGNPEFKRMSYEVISQIGSTVLKGEILPEDNPKTIVLKDMPNGSYVLILNSNGTFESKKFVVNK